MKKIGLFAKAFATSALLGAGVTFTVFAAFVLFAMALTKNDELKLSQRIAMVITGLGEITIGYYSLEELSEQCYDYWTEAIEEDWHFLPKKNDCVEV